ncbi:MAG: flagellar biosynthesis protein FliQ [Candidatus Cloacimonetes bacterium]|nr:flagellar biosynthesis protein FliQ [Candidatus Cloacimonadota bacterium]
MSQEFVIEIASRTMYYLFLIAGPILITGLIVGLLVSLFQNATQIKEMTLTFIPKLAATMLFLVIAFPWMMSKFIEYVSYIMNVISTLNQ